MTREEIETVGKEWQTLLGLNEWETVWKLSRKSEMDDVGQGQVKYNLCTKQAIVKIMDEIDWDNPDFTQDHEVVIVHELLHLKFSLLDKVKGEIFELIIHQYIQELAKSFVLLKRQGDSL